MGNAVTIQSSIKNHNKDMSKYALFLGGTNVVNSVLQAYDPLRTGYGRIFMVREPLWVAKYFQKTGDGAKMQNFRHILEYGNTSIRGINDTTVQFSTMNGGYTNKGFDIVSYASDDTNEFTIVCYEFAGSPIREVLHTWINGSTDLLSGLTHYNGVEDIDRIQANQTAEFIYVATDHTGLNPEYVCMFANCFPKNLNNDAFNYESGSHEFVQTEVTFTCTKYESTQINKVGQALLNRYRIETNSLNFNSGISTSDLNSHTGEGNPTLDMDYTRAYDTSNNELRKVTSIKDENGKNFTSSDLKLPKRNSQDGAYSLNNSRLNKYQLGGFTPDKYNVE